MDVSYVLACVLAVVLMSYLTTALLVPEIFS